VNQSDEKPQIVLEEGSSTGQHANKTASEIVAAQPPTITDHELVRRIGRGSYGEVLLARNVVGTYRAVKIVFRSQFDEDVPYEREFKGIQNFEPVSRSHEGLVDVLQIGRNDQLGYFYYVMELADDAEGERSNGVLESWSDETTDDPEFIKNGMSVESHSSNTPTLRHSASGLQSQNSAK
jgi:serine/threonine protein kinase